MAVGGSIAHRHAIIHLGRNMNLNSFEKYKYFEGRHLPKLQYSFHKLRVYPNGKQVYTVKLGKQIKREEEIKNVTHWLANAERSARRVYDAICDLFDCNKFEWFVTLTFTSDEEIVSDRKDDKITRDLFSKWRKFVKRKYPNMKYISIAEYHKKGGIHFHMLVGGVSASDLGFVFSHMEYSKFAEKEIPIYHVTAWQYGFTTASAIVSKEACKSYVLKYVVKGGVDPRFFRKQRFTCNQNLARPETITYKEICNSFDGFEFAEANEYNIVYFDKNHEYYRYLANNDTLTVHISAQNLYFAQR